MRERIVQLLNIAVNAPSGDNCQPWKFTIEGNQVNIRNLPEKDTSLYNFEQRASLIAHGALLENLAIGAPTFGMRAEILEFPNFAADPDLVATVIFSEKEKAEDPLFFWLERRCTNRKKFNTVPLTDSQKKTLLQVFDGNPGVQCYMATDSDKIRLLASILANNERLIFENYHLHHFLFEQIRWTDEEAKQTRDGMDIKTLELSLLNRLAFKILKYWPVVEILNKIGLSKIVAQSGKELVESSAGIIALTLEDISAESFMKAGRIMQRFWLQATALGLSVQPIIGLALLIQSVCSGVREGLDDSQRQLIMTIAENLDGVFGLSGKAPAMIFRIGTSAPPSARSLRLSVG